MRTADGPDRTGPRAVPVSAAALRCSASRREDVLAVVLGLLAVLGLVCAWGAGASAHGTVLDRGAAEAAERTAVPAVVTGPVGPAGEMYTGQQTLAVEWTARDGTRQTGATSFPGLYGAGEQVTVWLDRDGRLTVAPATASDAMTVAVGAGFLTSVAWGVLLVVLGRAGFRRTALRYARAWELDWAAVEPRWSGRRTT
ncbi:Rv1733c family protein [Pseudonocardia sp. HH130630-07]|uniref:Rv1733c family protein n=1 Tax=Pseudonocardia sp. HH130630-07 TaxID=1690815 RepID=UPI000814FD5A|nr:hypothetical protein [Pseudonocardia sp. HH130630-07]ANY09029.1 hypothetical protein AFB00_25305 [Pseudonocardia sp. HH130630-07]